MYVGHAMRKHVPTITSDTLLTKADLMMEENKLWVLLVVDDGILKGYVSKEDVRAALPSGATTFSKHELNYLLSKMTVKKLIRTDMPTVTPETEIEVAAKIMHDRHLDGLAVVDKKNRLKGYINRLGMLAVLVEEMGLELGGYRIAVEAEERKGIMAEISKMFFERGVNIISTSVFFRKNKRMIVFRIQAEHPEEMEKMLREAGYMILGPEHFEHEWE